MTNEVYPVDDPMPTRHRIHTATLALVAAIGVCAIAAMLIINARVGLWTPGQQLHTGGVSEFRGGIEPMKPAGSVGSGLHLPLGGR